MSNGESNPFKNWRVPPSDAERAILAIAECWRDLKGRDLTAERGDLDLQNYLVPRGHVDLWNTISQAGGGCVLACIDAKGGALRALWRIVDLLSDDLRAAEKPVSDYQRPAARPPITVDEANATALKLAKKDPEFVNGGVRKWAAGIRTATGRTCSTSTVKQTEFWARTMKKTGRGRTKGAAPKGAGFTKGMEATIGDGEHGGILERLAAAEVAAAEEAIDNSGMDNGQKTATLEKLRRDELSPKQATELASVFPPKPATRLKRFRQV